MILLDTTDTPVDLTTDFQQIGAEVLNNGNKEIPLAFIIALNDSDKVLVRIETQTVGQTTWQPLITEMLKLDGTSENIIQEKELVFNVAEGLIKFSIQDQAKKFRVMARVNEAGATEAQITKLVSSQSLKPGNVGGEIQKEIVTVSMEHQKIHEGDHYTCQDYDDDVAIAAPKYWLLRTPDSAVRIHLNFSTRSSFPGIVELFENPTLTDDGDSIDIFNNDRNSSKTTGVTCFKDPVTSNDGTRIPVNVMGSDQASIGMGVAATEGGVMKRDKELILKPNEDYIVKFTAVMDDARVSNCFEFYED